MSKVKSIHFDFDSYDFWHGWSDEELENVNLSGSMRKYFTLKAERAAAGVDAPWTANWERESGTGDKFYIEWNGEPDYDLEEEIGIELGWYIDQNEWVVEK